MKDESNLHQPAAQARAFEALALTFAGFLRRLAVDSEQEDEWQHYVVAHYRPEEVEEIRRELVRLSMKRNNPIGRPNWIIEDRAKMLEWARQIDEIISR